MKRIAALVVGVAAVSVGAFAQDAALDKLHLAPPAQLIANARVFKWKAAYQFDALREPQNNLVCYYKGGMPGVQQKIYAECTDKGNLKRVEQNLKAEAMGDRAKSQAELNKEEAAGTREKPVYGSVWYHAMGDDPEHLRTHLTIAVP